MTKSQHKRTAAASMFQNGISRNTKCAIRDGFRRDSHKCNLFCNYVYITYSSVSSILYYVYMYIAIHIFKVMYVW